MHARWLFALGLGTGLALTGLLARPRKTAFDDAPGTERASERASGHDETPATAAPPTIVPRAARPPAGQRVGRPGAPEPTGESSEADEEEPLQRDAARQALDTAFAQADREPRDEAWAAAMERSIEAALDQVVVAAPVSVGKPDCRSRHCQLVIEWADRDAALTSASEVLAMLPGECARTITRRDDDQDEYDTYESRVLLDCPRPAEAQR